MVQYNRVFPLEPGCNLVRIQKIIQGVGYVKAT